MSVHRLPGSVEGRLRATAWRGDEATAQLAAPRGRPTDAEVAAAVAHLRALGYRRVVTSALGAPEQEPFLRAGFVEHERLHLLRRDVERVAVPRDVTLRRARPADHPAVLEVDGRAFRPFWRFDEQRLEEALQATPSARMRVALRPDGDEIAGYAVTGRAAARGYLQRLAVDPACQRAGIGTALVADGVRWLRRWGAREVLVNTQEDNAPALALYRALGFELEPVGLRVLRLDLEEALA